MPWSLPSLPRRLVVPLLAGAAALTVALAPLPHLARPAAAAPASSGYEYYRVTVSRKASNWYRIHEVPDLYVRTSACIELALMQDALLKTSADRPVELQFLDSDDQVDEQCMAVGLHTVADERDLDRIR